MDRIKKRHEDELQKLKDEIDRLKGDSKLLSEQRDYVKKLVNEISDLHKKLEKTEDASDKKIKEMKDDLAKANAKLESLKSGTQEWETKYESVTKEYEAYKIKFTKVETDYLKLLVTNEEQSKTIGNMEGRLMKKATQIAELEHELKHDSSHSDWSFIIMSNRKVTK